MTPSQIQLILEAAEHLDGYGDEGHMVAALRQLADEMKKKGAFNMIDMQDSKLQRIEKLTPDAGTWQNDPETDFYHLQGEMNYIINFLRGIYND